MPSLWRKIPQLDFMILPESQHGSLSTVEGILLTASAGLQALQEERKKVDRQNAEAIDRVILKLKECATGNSSFTFIIDDPAGTSFVENPFAPSPDPSSHIEFYERTVEHQDMFGYAPDPTPSIAASSSQGTVEPHGSVGAVAGRRAIAQGNNTLEFSEALFRYSAPEEVMSFPSMCSACAVTCETRMYVTNIPYVREVIVMASTCDGCGYRSSELKTGGAIPKKGRRVSVSVQNVHDLSRDIIKSDTAGVIIPEIALELTSGTLGGLVTTVEGLVTMISEALERLYGFTVSDSLEEDKNIKWRDFRARLTKLSSLEEPWTLILDDALANSCIASVCDDIKDDHQLSIEEYDRSLEQNEELGLVDMDTSAVDAAYNSVEAS